ncbi:threonine/homoserine efflux transporter RhtA [Nocardiopsis mwathae]|uniref:Threonine/homoserine efflux transporter RhtA n=1 Tax=Nocardiopsis mwathae TaxID=1472723 RepID=A0A7W9YPX7_9ACTN|nr:hypothetical protein [Nocardiopsis mwathae]MBB6175091.1 threonine/homoserine efflux transporter RhtA [Nocardiopsis mwathae]
MLRKLGIAGLAVGAAMGAVLAATPANADVQANNNLQLIPLQVCNANVGVLGAAVPIFSPQTAKNCTNGPVNTSISHHHHKKHHGHHH